MDDGTVKAIVGRLAQVLGETIIHHSPVSSEIASRTQRRVSDEWLDRLEEHTTTIIGPLIDALLEDTNPPPEIAHMLQQIKEPTAALGSIVQQLFVYGLGFTLAQTALSPFIQELQNEIWTKTPDRPLSPADIAIAVTRGLDLNTDTIPGEFPAWAVKEAAKSGADEAQIKLLASLGGMPPAPQELFQLVRRGFIDKDRAEQGLREGDMRDDWIAELMNLRYVLPTISDLVRGAVQSQIPYDEASSWASKLGLEPDDFGPSHPSWFKFLYDIEGRPPGPVEMAHAANRGLTGWSGLGPEQVTFEQAIHESDIKTKYEPLLRKLAAYQPPNGEIKTMLLHAAITKEQAVKLWQMNGVTEEIANAYAFLAEHEQIAQDKAMAKGDILTLVQEGTISDDVAKGLLADIGFTGQNAEWLVDIAHFRYNLEGIRRDVRTVEALYTKYRITAQGALDALLSVGIPEAQAKALLKIMDQAKSVERPIPTASQVASGLYYGLVTQEKAMTMLQQLGYTEWDAWFVLSARMHGKLPHEPAIPDTIQHG